MISETAVIHGYYGSTAHKFAQEYNREFAALEECGHRTVEESVVPATMTEDGSVPRICKDCGEVLSDGSVICHPGKITLSAADYTYNGKTRHPSVAVKGRDGRVIASSNYKVTYTGGCRSVGKYTVQIAFLGNYSGKTSRTFVIRPKGSSISRIEKGKKKITVKWKKQAVQTTGYQIQYSVRKNFKGGDKGTILVKQNKKTSAALTKLKRQKKYYVRIRTYKNVKMKGKSVEIYSNWSKTGTAMTK